MVTEVVTPALGDAARALASLRVREPKKCAACENIIPAAFKGQKYCSHTCCAREWDRRRRARARERAAVNARRRAREAAKRAAAAS